MTKYITLLVLALASTLFSSAYNPISFTLPADSTISNKNICKNLRVIDMRKNKEQVGAFSFSTIDKMETRVITERPLPDMLSGYFDRISYKTKGEYELLLVLHDFWIMKKINDMNFGHFFFSGDIYIGKDGKYTMLDSVDEIYELNTSKQFVGNLMEMARQATFQLLNIYATVPIEGKKFTISEQDAGIRRDKIKAECPVYTGNFKKGIYYTPEQFLANAPADTAIVVNEKYIDERRRLYYYHHLNEKGKAGKTIKGDEFFALYDGKRWHAGGVVGTRKMVFENGEFIALRLGYGIVTPYRSSDMQMMGMAGMAGGVIGSLVSSAVSYYIATSGVNNKAKENKKTVKAYYICRYDPGKKEFVAIEREIMY